MSAWWARGFGIIPAKFAAKKIYYIEENEEGGRVGWAYWALRFDFVSKSMCLCQEDFTSN